MNHRNHNGGVAPVVVALCVYFMALPLDFLGIGNLGSISKILALVPIVLAIPSMTRIAYVKIKPIEVWLFLFLLAAIGSYFYSILPEQSRIAITTLAMNTLMVIILGKCPEYTEKEVTLLRNSLIIGSWIAVMMLFMVGAEEYGRMTLSLWDYQQDQNYLCGFMIFAFIYHFTKYLKAKRPTDLGLSILIVCAVITTGSRGALIAYGMCIVSCVIYYAKENGRAFSTIVVSTFGVLAAAFIIIELIMPRLDSMLYHRYTLQYLIERGTVGRAEIWKYLLSRYMEANLFRKLGGFGYGTTTVVNNMPSLLGGHVAHNLYIDNLISLGAIGLGYTILLHLSCIRAACSKNASFYLSAMIGYIGMCFSMSLNSYKPLWCTIMMIMISSSLDERLVLGSANGKRMGTDNHDYDGLTSGNRSSVNDVL